MVAMMSLSLTACGDGDEDDTGGGGRSSSNPLVGTWRYNHSSSDYCTYTFNSSGSGNFVHPSQDVNDPFNYRITSYDSGAGPGDDSLA